MNDQQEAAPLANDLMLGPAYGSFGSAPDTAVLGPQTRTPSKGVYAFAFTQTGLIPEVTLAGAKIIPIQTREKP